ncbi:hypothetical protein ACEPPN_002517 [Leptodophora sp. 'Broadleaf-Isolate-01']
MSYDLPPTVHISTHPCLQAKLSQLRQSTTNARETKALVHEISLIVACEATAAGLTTKKGESEHSVNTTQAIQTLLPDPAPVHHLGLFREPTTLEPVEYYNNLPYHRPAANTPSDSPNSGASELAILLDPVIATGGTCAAAIQTLKEWGVKRVIVIAILGALPGLQKAANEWPEGVEIWVAGVDGEITERGMIKPGLGDVGDRLFLTIGK